MSFELIPTIRVSGSHMYLPVTLGKSESPFPYPRMWDSASWTSVRVLQGSNDKVAKVPWNCNYESEAQLMMMTVMISTSTTTVA